ncbi:cation:proton antiporter [Micromonospora radicis]|uniref:Cation/H(+) antiporter n=1 Tax=Micromonospora radicis TaxID=1894971 RepID=A0A418MXD7_9ACTN|nr:cation:proton antiporter [Micromonospora radicis]RIV39698.1 cation/H(+) antiporter [Micromonospora radicis]
MPSMLEIAMHLFLQMAVILAVYRLLWPLFRRLGQVQVVAIMVAGFLLGPSLFGLVWPQAQEWMFPLTLEVGGESMPHPSLTAIYVIGQLGLVVYMFLVGCSFNLGILREHVRTAGATASAGLVVPLLIGGVLGWWLTQASDDYFTAEVAPWQGALFIGSAIAITAFPMLAWIVYDSGLLKTRLGTMALACAASDDACAWILLAIVVATASGGIAGGVVALGGGLAFLLLMMFVGRPLLSRLDGWAARQRSSGETAALPVGPLTVTLIVVLGAAWFTDFVGIYSVFGAFVAGAAMPRGAFVTALRDRVEPLAAYLLLPAFFIYSGLNTKLSLIFEPSVLLVAVVVLVASFAGKFGAVGLAARWQGMTWREAGSMGALANARGLMELILLNIGLSAGLLTQQLYTVLAIMAIVTTFAATPLHRMFERGVRRAGLVYGPSGLVPDPTAQPTELVGTRT